MRAVLNDGGVFFCSTGDGESPDLIWVNRTNLEEDVCSLAAVHRVAVFVV